MSPFPTPSNPLGVPVRSYGGTERLAPSVAEPVFQATDGHLTESKDSDEEEEEMEDRRLPIDRKIALWLRSRGLKADDDFSFGSQIR